MKTIRKLTNKYRETPAAVRDLFVAAAGFLPIFAAILVVSFFFINIQRRTTTEIILNNELQNTDLQTQLLEKAFVDAVEDILYISRLENYINLSNIQFTADNARQIVPVLKSFLLRKAVYDDVRVFDSAGREIVRVEYGNGNTLLVPADELKDTGGEYYTQTPGGPEEGNIYISGLDLTPVIRLATPVYTGGSFSGIVVLSYRGGILLEMIKEASRYTYGEMLLVNNESSWCFPEGEDTPWKPIVPGEEEPDFRKEAELFAAIDSMENGHKFLDGSLVTVGSLYPLILAEIEHRSRGTDVTLLSSSGPGLYEMKVASFVRNEVFLERIRPAANRAIIVAAAISVTIFLLFFFIISMRSRRIAAEQNVLEQAGIFVHNPAPVIKTDRSGRITSTNPSASKIIKDGIVGRQVEEVLEGFGPEKEETLRRQGYTQFEEAGKGRTHLYSGIMDESGEAKFFYGTDITERKAAEKELKLLSLAVEQSANTIVITDTAGSILFANKAFTRTTGYSLGEAMGQNPRILKSGHQPNRYYQELWETITQGNVWHGEFHNRRKDGSTYWEEAVISPVKDVSGRIINYLAVKEDITQRRLAEEQFRQAKEEAEAANRLKSEFLANMSHEIRTPMNAILGFTGLLLDEENDSERYEKLDIIRRSGKNLLNLLNDILDFSKIEAGKMELEPGYFSIRRAVEHVASMYRPVAQEKGLYFRVILDEDIPDAVYGDELKINQILLNIVSNAVKFTDEGGVTIRCSYVRPDAIITISDTGIGITDDKLKSIFSAFEQGDSSTERKYGGTGLGLAISKRLAEMMNGRINVLSSLGAGAAFTLTIDLPPFERESAAGPAVTAEDEDRNGTDEEGEAMLNRWFASLRGDEELEEILRDSITELIGKTERLEDAVMKRRCEDIRFIAHDMKGFTGNLNMLEIYREVEGIEAEAVSDSPDFAAISSRTVQLRLFVDSIPEAYVTRNKRPISAVPQLNSDYSVLLAEDNRLNQRLLVTFLSTLNVDVTVVDNGRDALHELGNSNYNLLLLDMQMPVMDGEETIREIRGDPELKDLYVIAITAHAMKGDAERYIQIGCDDYIPKPIDRDMLTNKIRNHMITVERAGVDPQLKGDLQIALDALRENRRIFNPAKLSTVAELLNVRFSHPDIRDIAERIKHAAAAFDDHDLDEIIGKVEEYLGNSD